MPELFGHLFEGVLPREVNVDLHAQEKTQPPVGRIGWLRSTEYHRLVQSPGVLCLYRTKDGIIQG